MTNDLASVALTKGREQANHVLAFRRESLQIRANALRVRAASLNLDPAAAAALTSTGSAGVLVAEGDSWFDYPFHDILEILEDYHGYDVESVAHKGDAVEEMAYSGGQLEEFTRRLEKLLRRGTSPRAILLSGGGNDVVGDQFATMLNHASSAAPGINQQIMQGVIDERVGLAYVFILGAVTQVCESTIGRRIPILVHGYDYPVPDGRGYLGGFWILPGPWMEPGFRQKGYMDMQERIRLGRQLIDRLNNLLIQIAKMPEFQHVRHIDLRNTLSTADDYRDWWDNELHPTHRGFDAVTAKFLNILNQLP